MRKTLNPNEILKEVNKFDKEFGVKLKHSEIWLEPSNYKETYNARCEIEIAQKICAINGVDVHEYYGDNFMEAMGMNMFPVNVNDKEFTDLSILGWDDNVKTYWTDTVIFKSRFLTYVLSRFMGRMNKTGNRKIDDGYICQHSEDEQKILYTNEIMKGINTFVNCLYQGNYKNIILKMHMHLSYTAKNIKRKKLLNRLNTMIIDTRRNMTHKFFKKAFFDDDLCINNLLQISYILATDDYEGNHGVPKFKKIEGATRNHDLSLLIEKLGRSILTSQNKYNLMFKAFIKARPKVFCEYKNVNEDSSMRMGVLALEYTRFVMNDKNVDKFIKAMLRKGK